MENLLGKNPVDMKVHELLAMEVATNEEFKAAFRAALKEQWGLRLTFSPTRKEASDE